MFSKNHIFGGLHLAGSNSNKTALVILNASSSNQKLIIKRVYEKIGSYGSLYSDDRLLKILKFEGEPDALTVDTPLTVPPCVRCILPSCPGVSSCDDVEVAYLLAKARLLRSKKKGRKVRPINPQCHRLWDVEQMLQFGTSLVEPSYSSNLAPLVIRGQVLQKRLRTEFPGLILQETSVGLSLNVMAQFFSPEKNVTWQEYHDFYQGSLMRREIFHKVIKHWFEWSDVDHEIAEKIIAVIPVFNAFICALNAYLFFLKSDVGKSASDLQRVPFIPSATDV